MPDVIIYLGPSLPESEAAAILPASERIHYLPPVRRGDLIHAIAKRPRIIGIIDGLFFENAAVGHREVLEAIRTGIRVIGASSMGALRAAELTPFGMEGVGEVFRRYRDGILESDDEVALICDPDSGTALSEALVNIRITLERAGGEGVITGDEVGALIATAQQTYYPERTWDHLLRTSRLSDQRRAVIQEWVMVHRVDQKAEDARTLLRIIAGSLSTHADDR